MINLWLFGQFAQFSVMLFGGGYMIIPLLMQTFVSDKNLLTMDEFSNLLAIAQMTPGAISMNAATYVGFVENRIAGALAASIGLVFPTLFLSSFALRLLNKWKNTHLLTGILTGARLAALSMIIYACLIFMDMSVFTQPVPWQSIGQSIRSFQWQLPHDFALCPLEAVIAGVCCFVMLKKEINVVFLILGAAFLGAGIAFF